MAPKKDLKVAVPASLGSPPGLNPGIVSIDWKKCILCQKRAGADLRCPANNPVKSLKNRGYLDLSQNLEHLKPHDYRLPSGLLVSRLDEGGGIFETFIKNKACWHKSCANPYLTPRFKKPEDLPKQVNTPDAVEVPLLAPEADERPEPVERIRTTRSGATIVDFKADLCFLCTGPGTKQNPLRKCATIEQYKYIEECAQKLGDTLLVAALRTGGDLIAMEAKYHPKCLLAFYNRSRRAESKTGEDTSRVMCEGIAFADLSFFMQDKIDELGTNCVFKVKDLRDMYQTRLAQLRGIPESLVNIHSSRLREKVLAQFPQLKAELSGREYVLLHNKANILSILDSEDQDNDALAFHRFARNLRKTLSASKVSFTGTFEPDSGMRSVPPPVLAAVNTILYGTAVPEDNAATQVALNIAQLLVFNFQEKAPKGNVVRHKLDREPPLPLYTSLSTYSRTRSKATVDELHKFGLGVSSNRVAEVSAQLCQMVVARAEEESVLCPAVLRKKAFTVAAIDNIDHNPSSDTASGSFHGTGISIFQPLIKPSDGEERHFAKSFQSIAAENVGLRKVPPLPEDYAIVPDFLLRNKRANIPIGDARDVQRSAGMPQNLWRKEEPWLSCVKDAIGGNELEIHGNVSWGAFHAAEEAGASRAASVNAMLPLFHESSTSDAMMRHGMEIVAQISRFLNEGQRPVLCADQPLFALLKLIQWNQPDIFSEDKFVVMLGPLHIEQSFLRMIGQLLNESGWKAVIVNSGIVSDGSAEAALKVTHITRARHWHQVTACALYSLLHESYQSTGEERTIDEWVDERAKSNPTFKFWLNILNLEILLLTFVRSLRQGNFSLYKECIQLLCPWYFALNHQNYARWLPVHLKDMQELESKAPSVYEAFSAGLFVIRKTGRPFSAMGIDQAHEQNNATVKAEGGAVGLTNDPSSLRRWTIGSPEICRLLFEFNSKTNHKESKSGDLHHEQYRAYQEKFAYQCAALKESFLQFENPFSLESSELIALDTRIVASKKCTDFLDTVAVSGAAAFKEFVEDRIHSDKKSVHDTISRTPLHLFGARKVPKQSRLESNAEEQSLNVHMFTRLVSVSQFRNLDMEEFFRHENQRCPPSLSRNGKMRPGGKHDLVKILEDLGEKGDQPTSCDTVIVDGAALVHTVTPKVKSLLEYTRLQLLPFLLSQVAQLNAHRLDVVWDLYFPNSTKTATRENRGQGVRRKDLPVKDKMPPDWADYLQNDENKKELFAFIAEEFLKQDVGLQVVSNVNSTVFSKQGTSSLHGASCGDMEEADVRIIWHLRDTVHSGATKVLIRATDTDVLVLAVSNIFELQDIGLKELWLDYGQGKSRRRLSVHSIAQSLGPIKSRALCGFHAFTGCDQVSFFIAKLKRSAWKAWSNCPRSTEAFLYLGKPHEDIPVAIHLRLQEFVGKLFLPHKHLQSLEQLKVSPAELHKVRKFLFEAEHKLQLLPPTEAALEQHTLRAAYQAGQIWGQAALGPGTPIPSPQGWGWQKGVSGHWVPIWSDLPWIWDACRELDICKCKTNCATLRCLCRKNAMPCVPACQGCHGQCSNQRTQVDSESDADDPQ